MRRTLRSSGPSTPPPAQWRARPNSRYVAWLDLYPAFVDASGHQIGTDFIEGLRPTAQGYRVWRDRLVPFLAADRQKCR